MRPLDRQQGAADKRQAEIDRLYRYLLGIASQPIHPLNISAKSLLLDLPRVWKVKA